MHFTLDLIIMDFVFVKTKNSEVKLQEELISKLSMQSLLFFLLHYEAIYL